MNINNSTHNNSTHNNSEPINNTSTLEGTLEIDHKRGVIWFHLAKGADIKKLHIVTMLRICSLGHIPRDASFIDITHMQGVSISTSQHL